MILFVFGSCSRTSVDRSLDARENAIELTQNLPPKEVAKEIVEWMSNANVNDREFARSLTGEILSIYDSIGYSHAREFIYAIDSIKEKLPNKKLARVYVVATGPWRLGVILREEDAPIELVKAVEKEFENDSISLEYFRKAYNIP